MNPQRDALSEALRELAAASPQASPELGARLSSEFARHHVQRRSQARGDCGRISGLPCDLRVLAAAARRSCKDQGRSNLHPRRPRLRLPRRKWTRLRRRRFRHRRRTRRREAAGSDHRTQNTSRAQEREPRKPDAEEPPATMQPETSSPCRPSIRRFRWANRAWCAWICLAQRCN